MTQTRGDGAAGDGAAGARDELAREQEHLDTLYARIDTQRAEVDARLAEALAGPARGAQALLERDAVVDRLTRRATALSHAEHGLCFGRLDRADGQVRYVGRTGLRSAPPERAPLLLDWRAPGARDFYLATAADNRGVVRRRHIATRRRRVVGLDDELLDLDHAGDHLVGEGALMRALAGRRTGRMGDIVATLQSEQDEIVRAGADGILVVQGGPGTGKTAVALHRAAYLLYSRPEIARRGVLVIGPSAAFLDYIGQVLPALGETHVVLTTATELYPVPLTREEPDDVARLKGQAVMAEVLAAAVRDRQGRQDRLEVTHDGETHRLGPEVLDDARRRAAGSGLPHNPARRVFRGAVLDVLVDAVAEHDRRLLDAMEEGFADELAGVDAALARDADRLPGLVDAAGAEVTGVLGEHERDRLRHELRTAPGVGAALEAAWPALTPERLLDDLLADPARLGRAAAGLVDPAGRALLHRPAGVGWSAADVALLDEAAELLGEDDAGADPRAAVRRAEAVRHARRVLAAGGGAELAQVAAGHLADRASDADHRALAERAAADRTWAYGHVVVDEAQELSPMAWRALRRRSPSGSMTVVGDVHQSAAPAGTTDWAEVFDDGPAPWRLVTLSVNYRTPAEVVAVAAPVLAALDPDADPPAAVRSVGERPWRRHVNPEHLADAVAGAAREELAALDGGHLAVVAPAHRVPRLAEALRVVDPSTSAGAGADLTATTVVLTPAQIKGLEFDGVLVVDPDAMLENPRGLAALYVALTRTTRRLGVVHTGEVPDVLAGIAPV